MPQLFGAACFLDTRLTRKLPNRYPSESDTLTQARAGQPSLVAQASIELRLMFRRHQIPRISLANRRGPERAETKPNPRRTNSLQHGCFYSGRIVRQTRTEFLLSGPEGSRGFESALSTIQSLGFRPFRRIARKARVCARFAIAHGPGERLRRRDSPESGKSYPGAILLGPSVRQARGLPMSPRQSNV